MRDGNSVNFTDDIYTTTSMGEMLFNIEKDYEGFYVSNQHIGPDEEEARNRMWIVCEGERKIQKFDTIKLGRVRFMVKGFKCTAQSTTPEELR